MGGDFATAMHIYIGWPMFEILCMDEDFGNMIIRNDEKMKVRIVCLKLYDYTSKKILNLPHAYLWAS